jgi:hypothetical protein
MDFPERKHVQQIGEEGSADDHKQDDQPGLIRELMPCNLAELLQAQYGHGEQAIEEYPLHNLSGWYFFMSGRTITMYRVYEVALTRMKTSPSRVLPEKLKPFPESMNKAPLRT